MMLDCGLRSDPFWFPSAEFAGQFVDLLVLQNLDEDHQEDLPYVERHVSLGGVFTNPSVTAHALRAMKAECGMADGVKSAHQLLQVAGPGLVGTLTNFGSVSPWAFWNNFGHPFVDTNNLSVVVLVKYGNFGVLFGGDVEKAGWKRILLNKRFREMLGCVKVYVASHHGRESGQCDELFDHMRPEIVVFSDDQKRFETQNSDAWYRARVTGIPNYLAPPDANWEFPRRHVLTTRRDGTLTIEVDAFGRFRVTPSRGQGTAAAA